MSAPVWEWVDAKARKAYEREHGVQPPGFRATGEWHWFARHHPDTAPCCRCGVVTDRWIIAHARVAFVAWGQQHVDQPMAHDKKLALCGEMWPFCEGCERRNSIAVLEQCQENPALDAGLKVREAEQLAALRAEEAAAIAA